jgi:adenylate kinase|tara:strand:- start:9 stop:659 length:651 start_codon:yes stop_codon:yes gene_type:complete
MNLIIFGPPGAGKGTQSNNIINNFDLKQVSTGDLLRNEIKLKTILGKKIESIIDNGELVSDDVVNTLIRKIISDPKNLNRLIFDGYPRTISQIHSLEKLLKKFNQKISVVINLYVEKDIVSKRIEGRVICTKCFKIFNAYLNPANSKNHKCEKKYLEKRTDDNSKTILNRYETYVVKTKAILDYYNKKGILHEIDGNQIIVEIYDKIKGILENIKD